MSSLEELRNAVAPRAGIQFRHGERLFCDIDDFCRQFEPRWHCQLLTQGLKTRKRAKSLSLSEIMTIVIAFHQQHYRNFKHYYLKCVCAYWQDAFPGLPSYQRFTLMAALYLTAVVRLFKALFWSTFTRRATTGAALTSSM